MLAPNVTDRERRQARRRHRDQRRADKERTTELAPDETAIVGGEISDDALDEFVNPSRSRGAYRAAFALTLVLIVVSVLVFPFAFQSMVSTIFGPSTETVFNLKTGEPMPRTVLDEQLTDRIYLNIAVSGVTAANNSADLILSGHRECVEACSALELLVQALNDDAGRHGMAPSAAFAIDPESTAFTDTVTLPVEGNPALYPFDRYTLKLAISGEAIAADGTSTPLTVENFGDKVQITVQDQSSSFQMDAPVPVALPDADASDQYLDGVAGQTLVFSRPTYIQLLTVLLVVLIGVSGGLSLLTRSINDLLIGMGGLILGVWGIRSVIMPQPMPTLSLVEVSLSTVILFILIGLAVRTLIYFYHQSELLPESLKRRK